MVPSLPGDLPATKKASLPEAKDGGQAIVPSALSGVRG
jgi:hypothetical protein